MEALWRELLEHHAALHPAYALRSPEHGPGTDRIRARQSDAGSGLWVAARPGGFAAGFCAAEVEASPAALREARRGLITELAVSPQHRRRGLATALLATALDWLRTRDVARVEVRVLAANRSAQAFWRARGFGAFVDVLDRRL